MFKEETFDFTAFLAWMEQIVDFILSLLSKVGFNANTETEEA